MRRLGFVWLLVGLGVASAQERPEAPTQEQIDQLVKELNHDRFAVRETASRSLVRLGRPAIDDVARAAAGRAPEANVRAVQILEELSRSDDPETATAAKGALANLADSRNRAVAARARLALWGHIGRIIAQLRLAGAELDDEEGRVEVVCFTRPFVGEANMKLLAQLPDLRRLSLGGTQAGDAEMAHVVHLKKLEYLDLYRSRVGDEGLKYLKELPNLRSVPMGETRVTDEGLVHLKDLKHLEYVGVRGNRVTDAGLAHLAGLTNLTGLYLGETHITDAGLVYLKGMTKLQNLPLHQTRVTDAGLLHLEELKSLRTIDLAGTATTPAGRDRLAQAISGLRINERLPK